MKRYFPSIKQYSWIVLVCTVLALIGGYSLAKSQPQAYVVSSSLFVNATAPGTTFPGASASATDSLTQASDDAAEIPTRLVMGYVYAHEPKIKARGFQPDDLLFDVTALVPSPLSSTISITATTAHAEDAVLLANAVATGFQAFKDQELQQHLQELRSSLQAQYNNYQNQSNALEAKILSYPLSDPHVTVLTQDRTQITSAMNAVQTQLLQLPPTIHSDVFVLQLAKSTDVQSSAKTTSLITVATAVGLILGVLLMLLMIFLDDRLRGDDQVTEKLGMAYLGGLSSSGEIKGGAIPTAGVAARQLTDIGANLQLTEVLPGPWHAPQGTALLVTSPQSAEGKTTIAAGLAASIARSGRSVLVIDGNVRKPGTHLTFGMSPASFGLSGLLKAAPGTENLDAAVQRTNTLGVWLMPAGAVSEDSTLLLAQKLPAILAQLTKKTDMVIIDGPSVLEGAEASLLASMVDGVALVVDNRHDKLALLLRAKDVLRSVTEKPVGVVINRLARRKRNPYYTAAVIPDVDADEVVHVAASNGHNGNGNGRKSEQVMAIPMAPVVPMAPVGNPPSSDGYAVPPLPSRGPTSLMDFSTMQLNPNPPSAFPSPREKR